MQLFNPLLLSPTHTARPSQADLQLLKWRDEQSYKQEFRLVNEVSAKWEQFGYHVGLNENETTALKREHLGNCTLCWNAVMAHWLNQGSERYPVTWRGLYSLLADVGCPADVARELDVAVAGRYSDPSHL